MDGMFQKRRYTVMPNDSIPKHQCGKFYKKHESFFISHKSYRMHWLSFVCEGSGCGVGWYGYGDCEYALPYGCHGVFDGGDGCNC